MKRKFGVQNIQEGIDRPSNLSQKSTSNFMQTEKRLHTTLFTIFLIVRTVRRPNRGTRELGVR